MFENIIWKWVYKSNYQLIGLSTALRHGERLESAQVLSDYTIGYEICDNSIVNHANIAIQLFPLSTASNYADKVLRSVHISFYSRATRKCQQPWLIKCSIFYINSLNALLEIILTCWFAFFFFKQENSYFQNQMHPKHSEQMWLPIVTESEWKLSKNVVHKKIRLSRSATHSHFLLETQSCLAWHMPEFFLNFHLPTLKHFLCMVVVGL